MTRAELLTGPERRRRWSEDEKAAVLAELAKPGASGAAVARRFGVNRSLVYAWRKEAGLGGVPHDTQGMSFAPVLLTGPVPPAEASVPKSPASTIEIEMKGAKVRLPGDAPAATVAAAIKALRGRS